MFDVRVVCVVCVCEREKGGEEEEQNGMGEPDQIPSPVRHPPPISQDMINGKRKAITQTHTHAPGLLAWGERHQALGVAGRVHVLLFVCGGEGVMVEIEFLKY